MKIGKSFRLPAAVVTPLAALAAQVDRSESWIVEKALREYLTARGHKIDDDGADQPTS